MTKLFTLLILSLSFYSCSTDKFKYPSELLSDTERKQFDKAVWLIYKFQYEQPVYEVDSPFKTPNLSLKKIDMPFVACDIILKGTEKIGDTLIFNFQGRYNKKQITHGPKEDDGIPRVSFIGSSDSIRSMDNFYVMNFPQSYTEGEDSSMMNSYQRVNSFVYDTLGESKFIQHIKTNEKFVSPTLRFICQKKGVFR